MKKEYKSLEELLQKKRKLCDGAKKKRERELYDPHQRIAFDDEGAQQQNDDGNDDDDDDDDRVIWGNTDTLLPDGGSIRDTSQTMLLDAFVKKKKEQEQNSFWGKLMRSVSELESDWGSSTELSSTSSTSISTMNTSSSEGSLLTKEIMFNIKEEKRMMEERERVKKSQELARKIWEEEQEKLKAKEVKLRAKKHVKQMKTAVSWGLFTMFNPTIDEEDETIHRNEEKNEAEDHHYHEFAKGNLSPFSNRDSNTLLAV